MNDHLVAWAVIASGLSTVASIALGVTATQNVLKVLSFVTTFAVPGAFIQILDAHNKLVKEHGKSRKSN